MLDVDFERKTVRMERGSSEKLPQMIGGGVGQGSDGEAKAAPAPVETVEMPYQHLFGVDGGGSAVRYAMRRAGHTEFYEEFINSGYKEMIFPKQPAAGTAPQDPHLLHIWCATPLNSNPFRHLFFLPFSFPHSPFFRALFFISCRFLVSSAGRATSTS